MIHVPPKVAKVFRSLSSIDVSAIMPRGAAGSSASDRISLPDRLGLMGDAFGRLLDAGLGAPMDWTPDSGFFVGLCCKRAPPVMQKSCVFWSANLGVSYDLDATVYFPELTRLARNQ